MIALADKYRQAFAAGQTIFLEGEKQEFAYIIESGEVEIFTTIQGDRKVLNHLGPGSLFGELGLVDRQPRSASAVAKSDTLLTLVTQSQVDERLTDADPILRMLIFVVMRHFRSEIDRARTGYAQARRDLLARDPEIAHQEKISAAVEVIRMEREIESALNQKQLRLVYQPVYDMQAGTVIGFEALVRWKSPTRGAVPPIEFMGLAETTSLIIPIGKWIICQGLDEYVRIREHAHTEFTMSFNIARRQMESPSFLDFLSIECEQRKIPASMIHLEMLERNLFQSDHAAVWVTQCSARGFNLYLDDFGTGYSSLQYLQQYQPTAVKIDQTFVQGLEARPQSRQICQAIINLAKALNIEIIAEGVETEFQANTLKLLGCRFAQGYYFSHPLESESVVALLTSPQV